MSERAKVEGIVLIYEPTEDYLNERQLIAYRNHREKLIKWLARQGKDPERLEGYAYDTYYTYANIICQFHRSIWDEEGRFTLDLTHQQADEYLRGLILGDREYSASHLHNAKLALKAYFRFIGNDWEPDISVPSQSGVSQPKDFVTEEERKALREAVLEYGSLPAYAALDPEERREWKQYLARRFGKPMKEVGPEDWSRANGFKYVSILNASLDAGLRPVEVGRAKTYWVDIENAALRIPEKDSSKNKDNWTVSLREETTEYLAQWLSEREMYEKYDSTESLWLTRHGNPYSGKSLRVLLDNLRDIAGIERDFSWYAIRHSTGTYMAREEGLAAAQSQLRHRREETTMKYDQAPVSDRREALNRMG
ncbi:site-specific integrase [Halomicrobium sp. LC1Hm]|uniref:tyrosine-type recombinase/integrase n=1 Tax=Halomicrobium sp. LC1Hm TaxID=2610902 RepID=UPI0012983867|nr:site-specific integrase [Halomicrobium sp. LC1Hm]QGA83020.1 XerD/XerC family integrase [Halomicrobium sp. LC1Hm]